MAQPKPLTPEKQLLKLIEESASGAPFRGQAAPHPKAATPSPGGMPKIFASLGGAIAAWFSGTGRTGLADPVRFANKILIACIIGLSLYFAVTVYLSVVDSDKSSEQRLQATIETTKGAPKESSFLKDVAYYIEKSASRDIFRMGPKIARGVQKTETVSKLTEVIQNLRLVGISMSSDPDVMVEDVKAGKTFFVKKGQMIGEVRVKEIAKDKIILSLEGEEAELR